MSEKCPYCKVYIDDGASVCHGCGAEAYYEDGVGWGYFFLFVLGSLVFAVLVDTWWSWTWGVISFGGISACGQQKKWGR